MQEIDNDDDDVNKRRVNLKNYSIRLSARGGVCAKFTVVYGQSRVVCVEWLPLFISYRRVTLDSAVFDALSPALGW